MSVPAGALRCQASCSRITSLASAEISVVDKVLMSLEELDGVVGQHGGEVGKDSFGDVPADNGSIVFVDRGLLAGAEQSVVLSISFPMRR
jgi:hypothetical protein